MQENFMDSIEKAKKAINEWDAEGKIIDEQSDGYWWMIKKSKVLLALNNLKDCIKDQSIESFVENSKIVIEKMDAITALSNKLDDDLNGLRLLKQEIDRNPFMVFKKREYRSRLSRFKNDLDYWTKLVDELKARIFELDEEYKKDQEFSMGDAPANIGIIGSGDHLAYKRIVAEKLFESDNYPKLKKFVFPLFKHSIRASTIYNLLKRLEDKKQRKIYWVNVLKFSRWYNKKSIYESLKLGSYAYYKFEDSLPEEEIFMFFDEELFLIWSSIVYNNGLIPNHRGLLWFERLFNDYRKNGEKGQIIEAIEVAKKLSRAIKVESRIYDDAPRLISSMTPGMVDLMIACDIRKIHNWGEVNILDDLKHIFIGQSNFKNSWGNIVKCWKSTIERDLKDVYYFSTFIKTYYLIGHGFFENLRESKIILNSSDLKEIMHMMNDPEFHLFREFPSALISYLRQPKDRKLVLITYPKEDYNLAFQSIYNEMKLFPREKFSVYFYHVNHPYHLAEIIRSVSRDKKIDLLLFGAHGTQTNAGYIDEESLNSPFFDNISECFEKDAKMYLSSCSTGKGSHPIAEKISIRFEIEVHAPDKVTGSSIIIENNGEIKVVYSGDTERKMFKLK